MTYKKKKCIFFILLLCFITSSFSQNSKSNKLDIFNSYSNWGYSLTPIVYNKASTTRNFGEIILNNKPMLSFQLGVKSHFRADRIWSFRTGLNLTLISFANLNFELKKEDVFSSFKGYETHIKDHGYLFLSVPLTIEYKKAVAKKVIFNSNIGLDIFYLTRSRNDLSIELISEELNEGREVFATYQETQDNQIQASAVFSVGLYFLFDKCMIQTNIVYNKNFQNLLEGEYQFGNLFMSEPTRGDYFVSGDYIGLSTSIYFKKRKKKR